MMDAKEKRLERFIDIGIPLVERSLGTEKASIFESRVWQRWFPISGVVPSFDQRINERLFSIGPPLLAVYRVLRNDFGMQQQPALELLDEILAAVYRTTMTSPVRRAALNVGFRVSVLRNIVLKQVYAADEPHGFRFEEVHDPQAVFGFDVRECALIKWLRAQEAPEIMPCICKMDDLMAEDLRGMTLVRTGTIGNGAERCDFRYIKKPS